MIKSASQSSLTNDVKYRNMGAANVPSSEYLIQTINVTSPVSAIEFTDLSQYAGIYRHLKLIYVARQSETGTGFNSTPKIRFNGDSGANYDTHLLYETDGGVKGGQETNGTGISLWLPATNGVPEAFMVSTVDIIDAYSTKNKVLRTLEGVFQTASSYQRWIAMKSGHWRNSSNISSISYSLSAGNLAIGSRFSLYGVTA